MCMQRARQVVEFGKVLGVVVVALGLYLALAVMHRGKPLPGDRDEDQD